MAALEKVRNKEDEENVIPAIFQQMERAEDSEGFDSCEEASDTANANPFQDFNRQINEVDDENLKRKCADRDYSRPNILATMV